MSEALSHHLVITRLQRRWLGIATAIGFAASLLIAVAPQESAAAAAPVPQATAGEGPAERPMPAGVRRSTALPEDERPPVVPEAVPAGGEPAEVSTSEWRALTSAAGTLDAAGGFTGIDLRPGFLLGDTSLVLYFDEGDVDPDWTAAVVRLYEEDDQTEQESVRLTREELEGPRFCGSADFCRSFGSEDGWELDRGTDYFVTVAAVLPDGEEVVSDPSDAARPRATILPPSIPDDQAAGCGCENALAPTAVGQAKRGVGVNTGTGAFVRVERDLQMASFGIPFSSARTYSSANNRQGPFGVGWAWSYDMRVTPTDDGVIVRAEDGAEAVYTADGDGYDRPPGVRSNLRRDGDGWELVTPQQVRYEFGPGGRLTAVLSPRDKGVRLAYDQEWHGHDAIEITDASGRTAVALLTGGLITRLVLPDRRQVRFEYTDGLLTEVKDARRNVWRYRYDAEGRLAQVVDPHDVVMLHNEYGPDDRVVSQRDGVGAETTFEWDAGKQEARTTDADDVSIYDGYHDNVLIYSQRSTGDADNHRYNGRLDRNLVVNGNQYQHVVRYDERGNPVQAVAPQGFDEETKYDDRNNPIEYTDADGNVWKNTYNEFNELVRSVDAEGHDIEHTYDDRGLRTSTTDQRGKVTRYEYLPDSDENAGLLSAVVSPEGRRTEYRYDTTGRQVAVTDPRGTADPRERRHYTTETRYDDQDRAIRIDEPGKRRGWRSVYDDVGRLVKDVTPEGTVTEYDYLDNGLQSRVEASGRVVTYAYTDAGRRTSESVRMKDADDLTTSYTYDAKGLVKTVTSPRGNMPGADPADFTTEYFYDANDNLLRMRMPYPGGGHVDRDIDVDALDRTTASIDELNKTSSFERSNTGQVDSVTDTMGRTLTMGYDRNGRQTERTDAGGKTTRTEYDEAGNKIKETSPTGGVTTYEYTDDGLLAAVTEPRGNVEGADKARFTTRYEYDLAGNRIREIDPLGNTTSTRYDANNRPTKITDARGGTTYVSYRDDDQVSHVRQPDAPDLPPFSRAFATVFTYDRDGRVVDVRDPQSGHTRVTYDDAGRPVTTTDPLGRTTHTTYDAESNPVATITLDRHEHLRHLTEEERARRTITSEYDLRGRLTSQQVGSTGPEYTYGYDAKDRTTSYGDPLGVRTVTYDDEDQITRVVREEPNQADEVFTYGYDERGNITTRNYPDGTRVTSTYDDDSRITSTTAVGGSAGGDGARWEYEYDVAGRRTATTLPAATGLTEEREYDDAGRLTAIGTERTGDPVDGVQDPVSAFDLTLDEVGNPTLVKTTRGGVTESVAYAYDEANRVTDACYAAQECDRRTKAAGRISYEYDLLGNRTKQVRTGSAGNDRTWYTYDAASQLVKELQVGKKGIERTVYEYDVLGNQTRAGDDRLEYHLDNTLAQATVDGVTTRYAYDASRMRIDAATGVGAGSQTRHWAWDVNGSLENIAVDTVTDSSGVVTHRQAFAYGPTDEPLALLEAQGGAHAYTHDWLGGVATMLAPDGQVEEGYDYDPFGNPREGATLAEAVVEKAAGAHAGPTAEPAANAEPAAGLTNPMRFAGAYQDSTTGEGNYALRARNYDPGTGRFSSVDPAGAQPLGSSPYVYASNNPLVFTDPTGERELEGPTGGGTTESPTGGDTTSNPHDPGAEVEGPSEEDIAKAQQIQSKSMLDVILEAGGQVLMEFLGINDLMNCLDGDLGACVMLIVGSLPWGKIFKAAKIGEAVYKAGKAVLAFSGELKWAKKILTGAKKAKQAAEAAKAAAAKAAREAAEKAAKAKAAAAAKARKIAEEAKARARAEASRKKAQTSSAGDSAKACNSFLPGTMVLLADGTRKPIEDLQPGDEVLAAGERTGDGAGGRLVTAHITGGGEKTLVTVTIQDDDGDKQRIVATDGHPFWNPEKEIWIDAVDLRSGDWLRTSAGTWVQVAGIEVERDRAVVHNLTVDRDHTYFVAAGRDDAAVLVHNAKCSGENLRRNLGTSDLPSDVSPQAHHIVPCSCSKRAPRAAAIMSQHGIDLNSAVNGVWMTRRAHQRTFTNDYYDYIDEQVASAHAAGGRQGVLDFLARTKSELAGVSQASLDEGWAWD
ncbi:polymorphic toxin-type HINT domain-containing protein [Myceligenerans pegani]|uniref:AHH domain-containing protein n=1 Tax=Myceligenerans pegani TaxID=2776917 RepID=A0ABR9MXK5_9MICO|nr:polymorphic toxin-type HINT domain-containing protein [Myceligenerans sp. TRM 65318]MBE1875860.1 AHH domain-containing protein [Myceligenerans sp. TRM 65318]MBE3018131.1 AHH domain-containing protein [Myceligenerans sp. TRM 65318]